MRQRPAADVAAAAAATANRRRRAAHRRTADCGTRRRCRRASDADAPQSESICWAPADGHRLVRVRRARLVRWATPRCLPRCVTFECGLLSPSNGDGCHTHARTHETNKSERTWFCFGVCCLGGGWREQERQYRKCGAMSLEWKHNVHAAVARDCGEGGVLKMHTEWVKSMHKCIAMDGDGERRKCALCLKQTIEMRSSCSNVKTLLTSNIINFDLIYILVTVK